MADDYLTELAFVANLERATPGLDSVFISNRVLQGSAAEIARLQAELNEARERLAMCVRYRVPAEPYPLFIEVRAARRWAVTSDCFVINRHGSKEYEPQPSERDEGYARRCYCDDLDEAFARARAFLKGETDNG